jgi:purine nucleosidase
MSERVKVIFDTDLGCDDAWALITLLKCEEKCNIELRAITIVPGNTSAVHASQNALFILKTLNRMDVKVYAGASDSLLSKKNYKSTFHGEDGLQDIFTADEKPSLDLLQKEHAVEAMRDLIEKVNIISIISISFLVQQSF